MYHSILLDDVQFCIKKKKKEISLFNTYLCVNKSRSTLNINIYKRGKGREEIWRISTRQQANIVVDNDT
jgi:hypothetical protein